MTPQINLLLPLLLLHLPTITHAEEASCTTSLTFAVRSKAKFSGFGNLYEFYHFIVDFAPTVAFELRDYPACAPKTLYLPGWVRDEKFHLVNSHDATRSMKRHHDALFGEPLKLQLELVPSKTDFENLNVTRVFSWNPHAKPWSRSDREVYMNFRSYAWSLLAAADAATASSSSSSSSSYSQLSLSDASTLVAEWRGPPLNHDTFTVLFIKRSRPRGSHSKVGAARRDLDPTFYDDLKRFYSAYQDQLLRWEMPSNALGGGEAAAAAAAPTREKGRRSGVVFRVIRLEDLPILEQVRAFSDPKVIMVVGMHGAGLSNVLFTRPGAAVIELGPIDFDCYRPLADKLGVHYVVSTKSNLKIDHHKFIAHTDGSSQSSLIASR